MEKNIIITIQINKVDLNNLSDIMKKLEELFKDYESKRIDVNVSSFANSVSL